MTSTCGKDYSNISGCDLTNDDNEILINNQNIKEEPEIEETPVEKFDKNVELEKKIEVKTEEKINVSDDDNKSEDDTLEKDLFNLIDSMYENKDEEEEE